jgi:putative ABC transport system permease protein
VIFFETFKDKLQEIFHNLSKNKLRTLLTGFSVSWGIFMLIILLGSGYGMEKGVRNAFSEDAVNSIWIRSGQTSRPHEGLKKGRRIRFRNEDYDDLQQSIKGREYVSGRYYLGRDTTVRFRSKAGTFSIVGVHPQYADIEKLTATQGRLLNLNDENQQRKVAIIGPKTKRELFPDSSAVGQYVLIKNISFQIIGVFNDKGDEWNLDRIFIPISTMQHLFSRNDRIHNLAMTIDAGAWEQPEAVETAVRQRLAQRHRFHVDDRRAVFTHNTLVTFQKYMRLFANIRIFVWIIGIGSIVAGIVGVSNIMLITVKERTREIGIRKAIGASPASIIDLIVTEAIIITLFFGYLGLVAGVVVLEIMAYIIKGVAYFKDPEVNLITAFGAVFLLVLSGALAGIFPARRAAQIRPVEALHDE